MPLVIDATKYIIGAADVYYRAVGSSAAWTSIGATVDNVVFRINQVTINPSENFNGVLEPVMLMDYTSRQGAEADFTMPQLAGPNLALAIRGVTSSVLSNADSASTPFSSTLAAASAIGDTNIKVVANTNLTAGDWIRIDVTAGGLAEYRRVDTVGTVGAGGTGVSFRDPLLRAHANGVATVESVGDGKTELVPGTTRRMPASAYNDFALVAQSPSDYYELYLYNAITTTAAAELTFGQDTMAGIKTTIGTRRDGLNMALPSWKLRVP